MKIKNLDISVLSMRFDFFSTGIKNPVTGVQDLVMHCPKLINRTYISAYHHHEPTKL